MSNTTQDTRIKSTTPNNKQSAKATMKERLAIIMMQSNIINVASTAGGSHQYCSMNFFIEKSDSLNYKDSIDLLSSSFIRMISSKNGK
jgi:hypothetical protein